MKKKPGLLFAVSLLAIIILAVSFNMNLGGYTPVHLREGINPDSVLYVCPASSEIWDQISESLRLMSKYIYLFFTFAGIVLLFSWGWALYQNLLKDKFSDDAYKNPWGLTKIFFWMLVVFIVIVMTPNHFRHVEVRGSSEQWGLCDYDSEGARAVPYGRVTVS